MLLGIMSDSHGDAPATARAVALLTERGATKLVHCGDICDETVLDELAGHDCTFVWGNCDHPSPMTRRYVASLGLPWPDAPVRLELDGKRIAVFHGHERAFARAADAGDVDYVLYGHTHQYADRRENGCRWINPGALHRARVRTVALLDVGRDALTFLRLDTGRPLDVRAGAPR